MGTYLVKTHVSDLLAVLLHRVVKVIPHSLQKAAASSAVAVMASAAHVRVAAAASLRTCRWASLKAWKVLALATREFNSVAAPAEGLRATGCRFTHADEFSAGVVVVNYISGG